MSEKKECWSADEETYNCESLGELLDRYDELTVGSVVHVGEAVAPDPSNFIDADDVICMIAERAGDVGGEYAEDYPDVSKEAEKELNDFLKAWLEKHCVPTFYTVMNSKPYTITGEDVAEVEP